MTGAKRTDGSTEYQYPVYDHRGTVMRLVDENGTLARTLEYDARGNLLRNAGTSGPNRFGYQSDWLTLKDSDDELCLSPMRLYHAGVGRFLQEDLLEGALASSGSFDVTDRGNPYQYAEGAPSDLLDSFGLMTSEKFLELCRRAMAAADKKARPHSRQEVLDILQSELDGVLPPAHIRRLLRQLRRLRRAIRKRFPKGDNAYADTVVRIISQAIKFAKAVTAERSPEQMIALLEMVIKLAKKLAPVEGIPGFGAYLEYIEKALEEARKAIGKLSDRFAEKNVEDMEECCFPTHPGSPFGQGKWLPLK